MCGIAGIVSREPTTREEIDLITSALDHRGPDAKGIYLHPFGKIALGHTRLSIIDLNATANQPFFSASGRYVIIFNGEVYNFNQIKNELITYHNLVFKTQSDTEVIAEAFEVWGTKMVEKLQGMFAIVILDQKEQKLFLFRDRLGKKPIYYFQSDSLFVFASEIKSLLKHHAVREQTSVNRKVISSFLHLGYIPEPNTIYTSIRKFPAGHIGEVATDLKLRVESFWRLEDQLKDERQNTIEENKNKLHSLLNKAVQKRLISDVPLGAFLSGGTDSSLVTALAIRHVSKPLKTFSIGFKESKFDERGFARQVANHLKTDHTEYLLSEKEAVDMLETYLHHFDEPFSDTSAIPTMLVSKLARQDVKVVLTGDGGDELFQGYGAYAWADRLDSAWWKMIKLPLRVGMMISGKSRLQRIAHMLDEITIGSIRSHIFSQEQYLFSQQEIRNDLLNDQKEFVPFEYDESCLAEMKLTAGEKQAIFDLRYYLKDDLLVKVDRASMFYALECRCPLLDQDVVEYALSLSKSAKVQSGKTKWVLKEILREYIPNELIDRPKWGFSIPLAQWLNNDLKYLMDYLAKEKLQETGMFDIVYVRNLVHRFYKGENYLYNRLWVIIIIQRFLLDHKF